MYLRRLHVQHLKLLKDFDLDFTDGQGRPRMWTVIIGENGTGKTSILQAVALAAAGNAQVNSLARPVVGQLRDRRGDEPLEISAEFGFSLLGRQRGIHPLLSGRIPAHLSLKSQVTLHKDEINLAASSHYGPSLRPVQGDPLDVARSRQFHLWFVAGYGVARVLPDAGQQPKLDNPPIERLEPLFDPSISLVSTGFANYFHDQPDKARMFSRVLKKALFKTTALLPRITSFELRGQGGVRKAGDLQERNRFVQRVGKTSLKVPAIALSHGYQSTIAWIADLVGHIVLEARAELDPEEMEGVVLIDELDLYLHPTWQAALVRALRQTFPRLQFVATTHSPLVLDELQPEEIIRLGTSAETGDVERIPVEADPRLMTGTEIYRQYFGIDDIYPDPEMSLLRDYRLLASNPFRSDTDERELAVIRRRLEQMDIDPRFEPVERLHE